MITVSLLLLLAFFSLNLTTNASPPSSANNEPIVKLKYGSFQGNSTGNLDKFLGIPFAAPPVGNLRFAPPQPPVAFSGIRQVTTFGPACFQHALNFSVFDPLNFPSLVEVFAASIPSVASEDCLFINVVRPANLHSSKKLPVLFWIYGGGFEYGDTSMNPGDTVVARSIDLGEPVIYVSANYRVSGLGFLGGKEVKAAGLGNVGLRDQRFALQWVQDNIASFGGDPTKVTIWGESAGAISVGLHLVVNDGNPAGLFQGAFMESGSPRLLSDIELQQPFFDQLVADTGCQGSNDPISCLRAVSFDQLSTAMNRSPNIFSPMHPSLFMGWEPVVDGDFIVRDPQVSIQEGLYAKVPIVTGDCDDEGTLFSLTTLNITTNDEFLAYANSNYFNEALNESQLNALSLAYPDNVTDGSPFDTGTANALTPEFKRIASFQGDLTFHARRRFFLQAASKTQPAYAFLFKRLKTIPFLGSFHSFDIPEFYGTNGTGTAPDFIGTDALVNFANTGNPNEPKSSISLLSQVDWKPWGSSKSHPPLLTFLDPAPNITITFDNFRVDAMDLLTRFSLGLVMDG
ncbi:carotenoid ester lipase precursor [Phlegmacium glaucopus]|nr:carotenoid ester lipase precursor [Phlegmacium glaucopus]